MLTNRSVADGELADTGASQWTLLAMVGVMSVGGILLLTAKNLVFKRVSKRT
ncbi:LPXTG cell wall anchor domain-containing protein [Candidatus Saccharibacteria bacterium]|nr:LPXTG cell wall anchor domain-containing protein [Candidatus Saccharibacteria bacterium]